MEGGPRYDDGSGACRSRGDGSCFGWARRVGACSGCSCPGANAMRDCSTAPGENPAARQPHCGPARPLSSVSLAAAGSLLARQPTPAARTPMPATRMPCATAPGRKPAASSPYCCPTTPCRRALLTRDLRLALSLFTGYRRDRHVCCWTCSGKFSFESVAIFVYKGYRIPVAHHTQEGEDIENVESLW